MKADVYNKKEWIECKKCGKIEDLAGEKINKWYDGLCPVCCVTMNMDKLYMTEEKSELDMHLDKLKNIIKKAGTL